MNKRPAQKTRENLIEAALDLFGRLGFEGTSTRAIADAASANLAAIKYHFGGKDGLYNAVAEHIAAQIKASMGDAVAAASSAAAPRSPEMARHALEQILEGLTALLVTNPATESWARFIVREQMSPSPAFDILYEHGMGHVVTLVTRLVATVCELDEDSEQARLTAITLIGQVLVFRVARAAVMQATGWAKIGERERDEIRTVIGNSLARLGPPPREKTARGEKAR
jgi:AcrR family transcriptional regulator